MGNQNITLSLPEDELYSEDLKAGQEYYGVRAENPFAPTDVPAR